MLALAALILLGGSLGDRFGRCRVFELGVAGFALASVACGLAPNAEVLIGARLVQGVAAALLTPGSLALIQGAFEPSSRAKAIGAWSGLGSIAAAAGPLLGGVLIDYASWRWIFMNVPLAVVTLVISRRCVPESRDSESSRLDPVGAVLGTLALGAITYALIEWHLATRAVTGARGSSAVAFVVAERRLRTPMLLMACSPTACSVRPTR